VANRRWGQTAGRRATPIAALLLLAAADLEAARQPLSVVGFERPLQQHELLPEWTAQTRRKREREVATGKGAEPRLEIISVRDRRFLSRDRPAPVSGALALRRKRSDALIQREAARHGIDPELVHAVVRAESAYDPRARSPAGACGLMQLMPATAARFGVADRWDPAQNIRGGVAYLRFLLERFDHDLRLALAAYNAGEGAVEQYGRRIPPYPETQTYVRRVLGYLGAV